MLAKQVDRLQIIYLRQAFIFLSILLAGMLLRAQYLGFESWDYKHFFSHWVEDFRSHDLSTVYAYRFTDYPPLYSYILGVFDVYFHEMTPLHLTKCISFGGEILMIFWAYQIIALLDRGHPGSLRPAIAVALVCLCPSVIINGSIIGQCDAWMTGFVLAAIYCIMVRRNVAACVWGGLALGFKPQVLFLAPFLLLLVLRRDMRWQHILIVPAVYVLVCIPAWLEGRGVGDLLLFYWRAVHGTKFISFYAANPYYHLNFRGYDIVMLRKMGEVVGLAVAAALVWYSYRRCHAHLTAENTLLLALLFLTVMPFVLPSMHDRYFFMADIVSLLFACMRPRWFILPVLLQTASFIAMPANQVPRMHGLPGWVQSLGMDNAIAMNACAIAMILWLCQKMLWSEKQQSGI